MVQDIASDKIPGQTFGTGSGISVLSSDNQVCLSGQYLKLYERSVLRIPTCGSVRTASVQYYLLDLVLTTIMYMYRYILVVRVVASTCTCMVLHVPVHAL